MGKRSGRDLLETALDECDIRIAPLLTPGSRRSAYDSLPDFGAEIGLPPPLEVVVPPTQLASQWFVKFFGEGTNRVEHSFQILDELKRAGCHWACGFPKGKRPRQMDNGDIVLMGRMVRQPTDTLIFGRAISVKHVPERDDATKQEMNFPHRSWKSKWPHYVRVHSGEFVSGPMSNGVSLRGMMKALGANAFATTQRNAARGSGNTNPMKAISQAAAVRLTEEGFHWLNTRLEESFRNHGPIPERVLAGLDWPQVSAFDLASPSARRQPKQRRPR
jgi:hypothetical protein